MPPELIISPQNPKVKRLLALQKDSSLRRETGLFVVEGRREIQRCIDAGFEIDSIFFCPAVSGDGAGGLSPETAEVRSRVPDEAPLGAKRAQTALKGAGECTLERTGALQGTKTFEVSKAVYEKIAYRGSTEGVIAEVRARKLGLEDLQLTDNPLIVVLESVEKPGNLGAVLRSADAAGAAAVLVCDPLTDLYNPNLIRSSTGAAFSVPCVACTSEEAIKWLKLKGVRILTAQLQDSVLYYDTNMRDATAIVMGTESTGLSQQWRAAADAHIRIPMLGVADSLNVSVSAAILLYEAVRQRQQ